MHARVRKNDQVMVITGKNKGKTGKVLQVLPAEGRVLVEHVNLVKRHTRANNKNRTGGIVEKEAPIAISNVMLIDNKSGKRTRVRHTTTKEGKKIRIAARSGAPIEA